MNMSTSKQPVVLTIEDERPIRESFRNYLEDLDYEVLEAENGRLGLELFEREKPNLVLLDLRMPVVNGLEVLAKMRERSPDTPVIVVSGAGAIGDVVEALHLGAWDYLLKPVEDLSMLQHAILKALERARLIQENRRYQEHLEEEVAKRTKEIDRAMSKLRASEEKYRSIFENLQDVYFEMRKDGTLIEISPSVESVIQYSREEILNTTLWDLYAKPEKSEKLLEELKHNKKVTDYEINLLNKEGTLVPCAIMARLRVDTSGAQIKICGTLRDITDRKRAEKELKRLFTAIEHAAEGIIITDTDVNIEYVNPAFGHITGYSREEVLGQSLRILESDKHDEAFYKEMWYAVSNGDVWKGRLINKRKDGTLIEQETTISPIRDSSGQIIGYVSVNRDVTEQIKLENQLRQAQKMEAIGTLAGGIAHDFNNILSAIIGFTELARMKLPENNVAMEDLDRVQQAGIRAADLVRQILTFGRQEIQEVQPIQIHPIVKEVLKLLRSSIPTTIEIRRAISTSETVLADPTQIHQVLMNLCTNAYHAMQEDGGILEINLSELNLNSDAVAQYPGLNPGSYLRLTVSDTGHGIDPSVKDRIFEPYFTTKEKGKGTGLGLSVVHGIIRNCGGAITVSSELSKGTTFEVLLPVIQKDETIEKEVDESVPTGNESILVVDDEKHVVFICKEMLERLGYKVENRTNSLKALELFRKHPDQFDLVLTDMTMPKMTGVNLAQEIMSIRSDIPIILATGFSERITEESAKQMGLKALLMKPFSFGRLANTVREVLDQKEQKTFESESD